MSPILRPRNAALQRTLTSESSPSTTNNSANASPFDSPVQSPSQTSLSSLTSFEEPVTKNNGVLLDTYGNAFEIPDYTIKDIRDAIPKHCFERSAARGFAYIARDIACLATTFYIFHNYVTPTTVPSFPLRATMWGLYTFVQGLVGTGLWVIAHECGHQSFSPSKRLNDTVGWILHSALLVPYFSWKISHGKHHKATGHLERDMVHMPMTRPEYASKLGRLAHELAELLDETPIYTAFHLFRQQIGGWPVYLMANVTGHDCHEKQPEGKGKGKKNGWFQGVNHFSPSSPLFERKDEHLILLSDLGLAIAASALFAIGKTYGWTNLLVWYFLPYLWVNHWLVAITFLQHTDPSLPHYTPDTWTFARGAAATIDRDFGFIGRHLFHGIIETHVLHHYVSTIPFYHADEASDAIRPVMGRHYRCDTSGGAWGFVAALWRCARWCQWVEASEGAKGEGRGVMFYRNRNGLGVPPTQMGPASSKEKTAGMVVGDDE